MLVAIKQYEPVKEYNAVKQNFCTSKTLICRLVEDDYAVADEDLNLDIICIDVWLFILVIVLSFNYYT